MQTKHTSNQALLQRAVKAALVAAVALGGVLAWHNASSQRTAVRVGHAQENALRLSEKKIDALAREAARDAAAQAFAEKQSAEHQARSALEVQQDMQARLAAAYVGG